MPITTRPATADDWPAIQACHAEIEALVGHALDLPSFGDPAILEWVVVEDEVGKIIGGLYLEKSVRQCHFGRDPRATVAMNSWQSGILASSKAAGVRFVHISVPTEVPGWMEISRHLEESGYEPRPTLFDHMADLRT